MPSFDEFDPYLSWLEIKPHEHPADHYRLLGVARFESDAEQIKRAADERMVQIRSFQTGPRGRYTHKLLNHLSAAKLCLLNPATKATYDAVLRGQDAADPSTASLPPPVQQWDVSAATPALPGQVHEALRPAVAQPAPPPVSEPPRADVAKTPLLGIRPRAPTQAGTRRVSTYLGVAAVLFLGLLAGTILTICAGSGNAPPPPTSEENLGKRGTKLDKRKREPPAIDGEIVVQQEANGNFHLPASLAILHGSLQHDSASGSIVNWTSTDDWISWSLDAAQPGFFRLQLVYAANGESAGGQYAVEIGKWSKAGEIRAANPPQSEVTDELVVVVGKKGRSQVRLRALLINGRELMKFRSLKLIPTGS